MVGFRVRAFLALVSLIVGLVAATSFEVRVPVTFANGKSVDVVALEGDDIVATAQKFADVHGLHGDVLARIIAAMEAESRAQHAQAPLLRLPVTVNDVQKTLVVYAGQNIAAVVNTFLAENAADAGQAPVLLDAVHRALAEQNAAAANAAAAKAAAAVIARVPVTFGDDVTVSLEQHAGESVDAAVASFAKAHNVDASDVPRLVDSLRLASSRAALASVVVILDGQNHEILVHHGDSPLGLARKFAMDHGLKDAPNFNEIVESIRDGIMRKVEAVAAQLAAPTPSGGSIVSPGRTPGSFEITVKLGSEFVRIEVDAGISPAEVAASFCERNWAFIMQELGKVMSAEDVGRLTGADCANLFVAEIAAGVNRLTQK